MEKWPKVGGRLYSRPTKLRTNDSTNKGAATSIDVYCAAIGAGSPVMDNGLEIKLKPTKKGSSRGLHPGPIFEMIFILESSKLDITLQDEKKNDSAVWIFVRNEIVG